MRCSLPLFAAAVLAGAFAASAHEHWIILETNPGGGVGTAKLRICSGHSFPESELALAERLLAELEIIGPGCRPVPYKPSAAGNAWEADVVLDKPGVWIASFALKKPEEPEAFHRGRAIAIMDGEDAPLCYVRGKGLEIALEAPLSSLKAGDVLPLSVRLDGVRIAGKIDVVPEKGAAMILSTAPDRPARLKLESRGPYRLSASHKGRSFSLTFALAASAEGGAK